MVLAVSSRSLKRNKRRADDCVIAGGVSSHCTSQEAARAHFLAGQLNAVGPGKKRSSLAAAERGGGSPLAAEEAGGGLVPDPEKEEQSSESNDQILENDDQMTDDSDDYDRMQTKDFLKSFEKEKQRNEKSQNLE